MARLWVNDSPRGVVFTGLRGYALYPAVAFYSTGRTVSLLWVEGPLMPTRGGWGSIGRLTAAGGDDGYCVGAPRGEYLSGLTPAAVTVAQGCELGRGGALGYAPDALPAAAGTVAAGAAAVALAEARRRVRVGGASFAHALSARPPVDVVTSPFDAAVALAVVDDPAGAVGRVGRRPVAASSPDAWVGRVTAASGLHRAADADDSKTGDAGDSAAPVEAAAAAAERGAEPHSAVNTPGGPHHACVQFDLADDAETLTGAVALNDTAEQARSASIARDSADGLHAGSPEWAYHPPGSSSPAALFEVVGDGALLWRSRPMRLIPPAAQRAPGDAGKPAGVPAWRPPLPQPFAVSVVGVRRLALVSRVVWWQDGLEDGTSGPARDGEPGSGGRSMPTIPRWARTLAAAAHTVWLDPRLTHGGPWTCHGWRNPAHAPACGMCGGARGRPASLEPPTAHAPPATTDGAVAAAHAALSLSSSSSSHELASCLLVAAGELAVEHTRALRCAPVCAPDAVVPPLHARPPAAPFVVSLGAGQDALLDATALLGHLLVAQTRPHSPAGAPVSAAAAPGAGVQDAPPQFDGMIVRAAVGVARILAANLRAAVAAPAPVSLGEAQLAGAAAHSLPRPPGLSLVYASPDARAQWTSYRRRRVAGRPYSFMQAKKRPDSRTSAVLPLAALLARVCSGAAHGAAGGRSLADLWSLPTLFSRPFCADVDNTPAATALAATAAAFDGGGGGAGTQHVFASIPSPGGTVHPPSRRASARRAAAHSQTRERRTTSLAGPRSTGGMVAWPPAGSAPASQPSPFDPLRYDFSRRTSVGSGTGAHSAGDGSGSASASGGPGTPMRADSPTAGQQPGLFDIFGAVGGERGLDVPLPAFHATPPTLASAASPEAAPPGPPRPTWVGALAAMFGAPPPPPPPQAQQPGMPPSRPLAQRADAPATAAAQVDAPRPDVTLAFTGDGGTSGIGGGGGGMDTPPSASSPSPVFVFGQQTPGLAARAAGSPSLISPPLLPSGCLSAQRTPEWAAIRFGPAGAEGSPPRAASAPPLGAFSLLSFGDAAAPTALPPRAPIAAASGEIGAPTRPATAAPSLQALLAQARAIAAAQLPEGGGQPSAAALREAMETLIDASGGAASGSSVGRRRRGPAAMPSPSEADVRRRLDSPDLQHELWTLQLLASPLLLPRRSARKRRLLQLLTTRPPRPLLLEAGALVSPPDADMVVFELDCEWPAGDASRWASDETRLEAPAAVPSAGAPGAGTSATPKHSREGSAVPPTAGEARGGVSTSADAPVSLHAQTEALLVLLQLRLRGHVASQPLLMGGWPSRVHLIFELPAAPGGVVPSSGAADLGPAFFYDEDSSGNDGDASEPKRARAQVGALDAASFVSSFLPGVMGEAGFRGWSAPDGLHVTAPCAPSGGGGCGGGSGGADPDRPFQFNSRRCQTPLGHCARCTPLHPLTPEGRPAHVSTRPYHARGHGSGACARVAHFPVVVERCADFPRGPRLAVAPVGASAVAGVLRVYPPGVARLADVRRALLQQQREAEERAGLGDGE